MTRPSLIYLGKVAPATATVPIISLDAIRLGRALTHLTRHISGRVSRREV